MKSVVFLLLLSLIALSSVFGDPKPKKPYVLYAQFTEQTQVELSTGAQWLMDKGDCFPVYMFKDRQTKAVLKLASATFVADASRLRIMKDSEAEAALESYRKNVDSFLKVQSENWQKNAPAPAKKEGN